MELRQTKAVGIQKIALKKESGREASKTMAGSLSPNGGGGDPEKLDRALLLECWEPTCG